MTRWLVLFLMVACGDEPKDEGTSADTDAADTDVAEDACNKVKTGDDWDFSGECPGMLTPCEVAVTGCDLVITYSQGMTMGMPTDAVVDGDAISFTGGTVSPCDGTVIDKNTIEGTCAGGCSFALSR